MFSIPVLIFNIQSYNSGSYIWNTTTSLSMTPGFDALPEIVKYELINNIAAEIGTFATKYCLNEVDEMVKINTPRGITYCVYLRPPGTISDEFTALRVFMMIMNTPGV